MSRVKKLAALRYRRFVAPVSVEEVLYRVNDAGCNIKKQTYLKYEGGTIPFNKADVKETVCEFFGVDSEFLGPNRLHHDLCTSIPELIDFRIGKDNKYVPIFEDFYQSSKTFEQINYPYIICNLIRYRGYHILLNGDAFGFRKRYADAFQEEIGKSKGFTELDVTVSGMGMAYVDEDWNLIEPFGFSRKEGKIFVGVCIENWDEFRKDIWMKDSRYRKFLDLLTDDSESVIEERCDLDWRERLNRRFG